MCFFASFLTVTVPKKVTPQKPELARTIVVQAEPTHFLEGDLPFHGTPIADRPTEDELPKLAVPAKPEPLEAAGTVSQIKAEPPPPPPEPAPQPLVALDTTGITPPPGILAPLQAKGTAEVEQKGDRLTPRSWPGLSRPPTNFSFRGEHVDARDKPGHDECGDVAASRYLAGLTASVVS